MNTIFVLETYDLSKDAFVATCWPVALHLSQHQCTDRSSETMHHAMQG